jgi:hypothetical protein
LSQNTHLKAKITQLKELNESLSAANNYFQTQTIPEL